MLRPSFRSSVVIAMLALCMHTPAQNNPTPQPHVLSAWTELVGDDHTAPDPQSSGHAVVRVITPAKTCPVARVDGRALTLNIRQAPSDAFPVTTCQARVPTTAHHIEVGGVTFASMPTRLERIIVLGDTGCRLKGALIQDCNDIKRWPFAVIAAHAAARHPDLIIHVGDYYYRETPCPATAPGCAGSPYGDAWPSWNEDFFKPAGSLLTSAPWIFVRGNHEQCGRGADGWFRMLDAATKPQRCVDNITAAPFTVRIDGLTLNVMDSADADDRTAPANLVAIFNKQYDELGAAVEGGHGWILTHRPIWGVDPTVVPKPVPGKETVAIPEGVPAVLPGFDSVDLPVNATEQAASDKRRLAGTDMVIAGHVHLFTAISFGDARPLQLVVGNGGDNPDLAVTGPQIRPEWIDKLGAEVYQLQRYGYFMMDRTKDGWSGTAYSVDDEILGHCTFIGRTTSCLFAQTLPVQLPATATP